MRNNNTISVIIPAYQADKYVNFAMETVLRQSYRPIEIVIIDDGSVDNTGTVVKDFCIHQNMHNRNYRISLPNQRLASFKFENLQKDLTVLYVKQENSGPSKARNLGISVCSGVFISFLDVDDLWDQDKLKLQVRLLKKGACDFVFTNTVLKGRDGNEHQMYQSPEKLPFELGDNIIIEPWRSLISTNYVTTSSVLAKKSCFQGNHLFNSKRRLAEDWELWLKLSNQYKFGYVHEVCVIKEQVEGCLSSDNIGMLVSSIEVLENFLKEKFTLKHATRISDPQSKEVLFSAYKWAGYRALIARNGQLAREYLGSALKVKLDLQTMSYYLRSHLPF